MRELNKPKHCPVRNTPGPFMRCAPLPRGARRGLSGATGAEALSGSARVPSGPEGPAQGRSSGGPFARPLADPSRPWD